MVVPDEVDGTWIRDGYLVDEPDNGSSGGRGLWSLGSAGGQHGVPGMVFERESAGGH